MGRDPFVRVGDVEETQGRVVRCAGDAKCAACKHEAERHSLGELRRCSVKSCDCRGFALWRGEKPRAAVARWLRALKGLGPDGELAAAVWSAKARPSAREFVSDMSPGECRESAAELAELVADVGLLPGRPSVQTVSVDVHWERAESGGFVPAFSWRLLCFDGTVVVRNAKRSSGAEAFLSLWAPDAVIR